MHPEISKEALEILEKCLRRSPEARRGYLAKACMDNEELKKEVESLLAAEGASGDFMNEPLLKLPHPEDS